MHEYANFSESINYQVFKTQTLENRKKSDQIFVIFFFRLNDGALSRIRFHHHHKHLLVISGPQLTHFRVFSTCRTPREGRPLRRPQQNLLRVEGVGRHHPDTLLGDPYFAGDVRKIPHLPSGASGPGIAWSTYLRQHLRPHHTQLRRLLLVPLKRLAVSNPRLRRSFRLLHMDLFWGKK